MCPYSYYQVMRFSKDKKQQRYQMVVYALKHGVKPTARTYATLSLNTSVNGLGGLGKVIIKH